MLTPLGSLLKQFNTEVYRTSHEHLSSDKSINSWVFGGVALTNGPNGSSLRALLRLVAAIGLSSFIVSLWEYNHQSINSHPQCWTGSWSRSLGTQMETPDIVKQFRSSRRWKAESTGPDAQHCQTMENGITIMSRPLQSVEDYASCWRN